MIKAIYKRITDGVSKAKTKNGVYGKTPFTNTSISISWKVGEAEKRGSSWLTSEIF